MAHNAVPRVDLTPDAHLAPSSAFYNALTLAERRSCLLHGGEAFEFDLSRAERRFAAWCSQAPFEDRERLLQRVRADGLELADFQAILGVSAPVLRDALREPPSWVTTLEQALAPSAHGEPRPFSTSDPSLGLLNPFWRLAQRSRDRLVAGLIRTRRAHAGLDFDPDALTASWFSALYPSVLGMLARTLVLELHVASVEGRLEGSTSRARFEAFCARLAESDVARGLFEEYPVLARKILSRTEQWVDFAVELMERLGADLALAVETFAPGTRPGRLLDMTAGAGDSHRGGRRVIILTFESGMKLVYKPRGLGVDVHFLGLVEWFNGRGSHPPLRVARAIDRGSYGWQEFVSAEPCRSEEEVHRFYQRQGAFIALLYVMQATDFHSENLIAAGEHPVLVDLESLLTPKPELFPDHGEAVRGIGEAFGSSVLRAGLLPHGVSFEGDPDGIDVSGLGSAAGQLTPYPVPYFEDPGTDTMHLKRERREMPPDDNRPTLSGRSVDLLDYQSDLRNGFRAAYFTLCRHRDELLASDGPLARFADDDVRPILRNSQSYALLLQESCHPDLLRDALSREQFLDRLWIQAATLPGLVPIIPAERADLDNGDVPIFTARPSSTDLWTSKGERITGFFRASALASARACLERLGTEDFDRQLWFLDASLATTVRHSRASAAPSSNRARPTLGLSNLDGARAVAERLEQLSLRDGDEANWFGLVLVRERVTGIRPLQNDLYDGLPGIALFLAYLGELTGEKRHTDLAERALRAVLRTHSPEGPLQGSIGAFDGWGGFIYVLTHLAVLWKRSDLLHAARSVVDRLPVPIRSAQIHGVLGGTAGCLQSLLVFHHVTGDARALEVAKHCGDRLIQTSMVQARGTAWPLAGSPPLAGLAHGAAGIAWALLDLAGVTGDLRLRNLATEAIQYERTLFSPARGNWADLRGRDDPAHPSETMTAWCHGAAGIGLARLRSLEHLDDEELRAEIDVAIDTTARDGFGANHSLCHGDLGNLELFLQASRVLDRPHLRERAERIASSILRDLRTIGWRTGVALGVEHPGLMTGLAGIGYGLLRLASPQVVPSLLTLEPPKGRAQQHPDRGDDHTLPRYDDHRTR